ncbi:hypothetical protein CTI12_AA409170 [Artemisia annua]|uniref:Retrotransposon Copia-like N-terminal domain-containing protein n=1 Tax=Artemisia annua TaxID=35608 RepID=A0A2U1M821_ARTAN|nr:hypothetical protein CTI12_AA409170 [Artemisia annua]
MSSSTVNDNHNNHNQEPNMVNDPLHLASSDHPGMNLTKTLFTGANFLGWNRTVKIALGAKLKLGFIDGSSPKPALIDPNYQRWVRCDYMVTCWILNSMVSELSESFLYAQSARDLWKELEERYGQSNGPLIYHVERELSKVSQGNSTVAAYFNKLKSPVSGSHEDVLSTPTNNSTEPNNHEDVPLVIPTSDVPTNDSIPVRRSSRTATQPTWLKDFVTTKHRAGHARIDTPNQPKYPLFQQSEFEAYPNDYQSVQQQVHEQQSAQ